MECAQLQIIVRVVTVGQLIEAIQNVSQDVIALVSMASVPDQMSVHVTQAINRIQTIRSGNLCYLMLK